MSRVSSLHQVAKVLSFTFSISPSNEYSGLVYFRIEWFNLLAVQGTLKSLQHHSSKASIFLVLKLLYGPSLTSIQFSSVHLLIRVWLFATPWTTACQASLSKTNYPNPYPLSRWCHPAISSLCRPLLFLPSIFPSIRLLSVLHIRWPKYWNFSFNISPSNEYPRLISFRIDWLYLLAVQGTLKSLLQHHSSKASILQHSAFFIVQLSHSYMITEKP